MKCVCIVTGILQDKTKKNVAQVWGFYFHALKTISMDLKGRTGIIKQNFQP